MDPPRISDAQTLDASLTASRFLLFKHSPVCPVSARAFYAYRRAVDTSKAGPTESGWIDVIAQRDLARDVATRTGIRHESPQAILYVDGVPSWHASHDSITLQALEDVLSSRR